MKKITLIFSLLSVLSNNTNAQLVAGDTPAGAHVIYPGDRMEVEAKNTTIKKDFDLNCDGNSDLQLRLTKGFSAVDMPNTLEMYVLDTTLKFAVDTSYSYGKKLKYYNIWDTLKNDGSYVWASNTILVGDYGCINCDHKGNYSALYVWYKNANNEIGWINLEFDLNDSDNSIYHSNPDGSSSYPVTALMYRALVYGDVDFVAGDSMVQINIDTLRSTLDIKYTIKNNGNSCSSDVYTLFYLSNDSIFDSTDTLVYASSINRIIPAMGSITNTVTFNILGPFLQKTSYIFYRVNDVFVWPPNYTGELPFDADFQEKRFETDSTNNIGSFKLTMSDSLLLQLGPPIIINPNDTLYTVFVPLPTVGTVTEIASVNKVEVQRVYVSEGTLNIYIALAGAYLLNTINMTGENVYSSNLNINEGLNKVKLPETLSSGIYVVSLISNLNSVTQKVALIK